MLDATDHRKRGHLSAIEQEGALEIAEERLENIDCGEAEAERFPDSE